MNKGLNENIPSFFYYSYKNIILNFSRSTPRIFSDQNVRIATTRLRSTVQRYIFIERIEPATPTTSALEF